MQFTLKMGIRTADHCILQLKKIVLDNMTWGELPKDLAYLTQMKHEGLVMCMKVMGMLFALVDCE